MSWYNDLRYISLLSIRFCRSEGNRTSGGKHICPCSSYYPFAFILLIGCKDSHLNAISNLPVEISADFLLDIKYLQCHFSNFCWTVVFNLMKSIGYFITFFICILLYSCNNNVKDTNVGSEADAKTEPSKSEISASDVYETSKSSIAMIICYDENHLPISQGSGFFIEPQKLVTNYHVIEGSKYVEYKLIGEDKILKDCQIKQASEFYDIAIIETISEHKQLKYDTTINCQIGEKVYVISNPRGLEGTLSEGIVSAIRQEDYDLIQTTAPISSGSSGSPLFNKEGIVIGVSSFTFKESQNLNFAIPLKNISQCEKYGAENRNKAKRNFSVIKDDALEIRKFSIIAPAIDNSKAYISIKNNTNK